MSKIAILGASGHGKVLAEIAELLGWETITFFDDAYPLKLNVALWQIAGKTNDLVADIGRFDGVIVAIGENITRLQKQLSLEQAGAKIVSLVHPSAVVSKYSKIGKGSAVMANAVVNPCVKIGAGSIINTGASVDHDCTLFEAVHIAPGARLAGGVSVGSITTIGLGAKVIQEVHVGARVIVGAGAVVLNDVADNSVVVGVPARFLRKESTGKC